MHFQPPPAQIDFNQRFVKFGICKCQPALIAANVASKPCTIHIRSKDNTYVKHCVKLRTSRSYRQEVGNVLLVGDVVIKEVLQHARGGVAGGPEIKALLVDEDCGATFPIEGARVIRVSKGVLQKISGLQSVDGVGAIAEMSPPAPANFLDGFPQGTLRRLLVLEGVQDPGNMGTLLRTALALGWQGVMLLPGCCDVFNDKAIRSSRGAAFRIPLVNGTWEDVDEIAQRHGLICVAAEPHVPPSGEPCSVSLCSGRREGAPLGVPLASVASSLQACRVCLALGSEGVGLTQEALMRCRPVAIPMMNDMESLNVSMAGAILMFTFSDSMPRLLADIMS